MKTFLYACIILCPTLVFGQTDSLNRLYKNAVSFELGGNTALGFNINYHRFWKSIKSPNLVFGTRLGVGTVKPADNRLYYCSPEISILIGRRKLKFEIGVGYQGVFGKQIINVFDRYSSTPQYPNLPPVVLTKSIDVNFYDGIVFRSGLVYMPSRYRFPFFRLSWTPFFIPAYNPAPYNSKDSTPESPKRIYWGWGGISLGIMF